MNTIDVIKPDRIIFYKRVGSEKVYKAKVLEVSPRGKCFQVEDAFEPKQKIWITTESIALLDHDGPADSSS